MSAPGARATGRAAAVLAFAALFAAAAPAMDLTAGLMLGPRTLRDPALKAVYGSGTVYCPYVLLPVGRFFFLGGGYEAGFSRSGLIGIYREPAVLKVFGGEMFAGLKVRFNPLILYGRAGIGRFTYRQTVESPVAGDYPVDGSKWALSLAGGARVELTERLFLSGELKWVPLKVSPYDIPVDLGGMRYLFGVGYTFSL